MGAQLAIAEPRAAAWCSAWHCRKDDAIHGQRCCFCNREIAVPFEVKGKLCGCIYCGMERGDVPCIELGPDDDGPPFIVTDNGLRGRRSTVWGYL